MVGSNLCVTQMRMKYQSGKRLLNWQYAWNLISDAKREVKLFVRCRPVKYGMVQPYNIRAGSDDSYCPGGGVLRVECRG